MDSKVRHRDYVNNQSQGLLFKLKYIVTEKKQDQKPTVDELLIPFEILKNFVKSENIASEMTSQSSIDVNYLGSQERYSHQSRSQTHHQADPNKEESPHFKKFCMYCKKNGCSIS